MDIQVLNEIASLARQASFPKVGVPVSANAQLKGLKGNPAPPLLGNSPEQIQAPVTPDISSVARAASAYSVAVGDGLNSDELNAIQDLSGKIRAAVSDFLSQPGLAQAENAATVVVSNPEAVQDFTSSVERAVVATLNLPEIEGEVIVNATPPNADLLEEIPAPEKFISVERITNGAEPNNPAQTVAASPAVQNAQTSEQARVETPVSRPDVVASSQQKPVVRPEVVATHTQEAPVTAASPAVQNSNAQNAVVENPANVAKVPETSSRNFRVTAASPAVQNAQASEHARVETPVSRPDVVAASQQEPVVRPEVAATHTQEAPVTAASPAVQNSNAQNAVVENPANGAKAPEASSRDFTVTAASPAVQNSQAEEHARVETPVSRPDVVASSQQKPIDRPEVVATHTQEAPVTPALQNANAQNAVVENPANGAKAPEASSRDFTVTATSPAVQNAQASEHARVETPVTAASPALQNANIQSGVVENPANGVKTPEASNRDFTVTAASPAVQNAQASEHARVETPVTAASPALQNANIQSGVVENPANGVKTPEASNRDFTVTAASPALQNANAQNAVVENPANGVKTPEASNRDFTVTAASPAVQNAQASEHARVEIPVSRPDLVASNNRQPSVTTSSPVLPTNGRAQNTEVGNPVNIPVPSMNLGQGPEGAQVQPVNPERITIPGEGASSQVASASSNPQPVSSPQSGPAQASDLFAQDNAAVKPENIRNVSELVGSVVGNELASEAKKIFSEPKVIRTVADLAEFILERLREIIAAQQQQSQSSNELKLS